MNFLHASLFAAGLASIAIPIAIHLLMRRRRKPVLWGAMRFIIEAYKRQRRRLMVERWLLLATRCALLALVAIALGRPLLSGSSGAAGGRTVVILLDNSLTAGLTDPDGTALERHKRAAKAIIESLGSAANGQTDRAALVTLAGPPDEIVLPPSSNLSEVLRLLEQVEQADSKADVPAALTRIGAALQADPVSKELLESGTEFGSPSVFVVVLSDFLSGSVDPTSTLPALPAGVALVASAPGAPATVPPLNVTVAGIDPTRPLVLSAGGSGASDVRARIRLQRSGDDTTRAGVSTVRLRAVPAGDQPVAGGTGEIPETRAVVEWGPGDDQATATLSLPPLPELGRDAGRRTYLLSARVDADGIERDNLFHRPLEVRSELRVGIVSPRRFGERARVDELEAAEWIRLALAPVAEEAGAAPSTAAGIQASYLDPAVLDMPSLAGLDALVIPRPDLLINGGAGASAWDRVRAFLEMGGLVIVAPPADQTVHAWPEAMSSALGLSWRPARETVVLQQAEGLTVSNAPGAGVPDLLVQLRAELGDLARPVQVSRVLPVQHDEARGTEIDSGEQRAEAQIERGGPLVTLSSGEAFLYVDRPSLRSGNVGDAAGISPGLLVYMAAPPDLRWTDLPAKPLMVPLLQEIVRQGAGLAQGSPLAIAGQPVMGPPRAMEIERIGAGAGDTTVELGAGGLATEPIRHASLWRATDGRGAYRGMVAVNPNPLAGRITPHGQPELQRWLGAAVQTAGAAGGSVAWLQPRDGGAIDGDSIRGALQADDSGLPVSLPFLLAAIALGLFEVFLARRASHAELPPPESEGGRMSEVLRWLLSLDRLNPSDAGVEFALQRPLPSWGWALVILFAGLIAWAGYRRLEGRRGMRIALATARAALLVLLALLIAGPRLVRARETEEKDWVIVLVDRSASMTINDVREGAATTSRDAQLESAISASWPMWKELAENRIVMWMGFDAAAYDLRGVAAGGEAPALEGGPDAMPRLGDPVGRRTSIGRALEQALRRAAGRPLAGVVIMTDGRSTDEPSRTLMRRLEAERVPVFTVPLGSAAGAPDVAVTSVDGPDAAFVEDLVPIQTTVRWRSVPEGAPIGKVQLVEQSTGIVLDEQDITSQGGAGDSGSAEAPEQTLILTGRVEKEGAGRGQWIVRVIPSGDDLIKENNEAPIGIQLEDRPLRVLYFEGYPRWEYRYLKNLLVREGSVRSASLILSDGRRFVQEGDAPLAALPSSPEEWRQFDVVVMGDVHPGMFSTQQLEQLREHIGQRGAGLLWIGGEGSTPTAWATTPLVDLLPFTLGAPDPMGRETATGALGAWDRPVVMLPAPAAERFGVMRLSDALEQGTWWPLELAEHSTGWSRLLWAQRLAPSALKPATEVLAVARTEPRENGVAEEAPVVVTMRFGAGRVLYVATDETWRWRYGRGEHLPERFWLQMVRMLGRESLTRSGRAARLVLAPQRAQVDQPVQIVVEMLDQRLIDRNAAAIRARVVPVDLQQQLPPEDLSLVAEPDQGQAAGVRRYESVYSASRSGRYRVEVADPVLDGERLTAELEIWLPDDEMLRPDTNHELLSNLSQSTGGEVIPPSELTKVRELLPNRGVRLIGTPEEETLWDTPLALILLLVLVTFEWVGRRLIRLA